MEKLINELKNREEVTRIWATDDEKIILIENKHGAVITINGRFEGYQWSVPIIPNITSGSAYTGTKDYWDYIDFDFMVNIATGPKQPIPYSNYNKSQISSIIPETFDQHLKSATIYKKQIK